VGAASILSGGRVRGAVVLLAAVVAAGCVGAEASAVVSPTTEPSGGGSAPPTTPLGPWQSAPATDPVVLETPTASPTAVPIPPERIPTAPEGVWTGVTWTRLPATPEFGAQDLDDASTFQVFGWSKGFVGFSIIPNPATDEQNDAGILVPPTVVSSYSSDGVHWHRGGTLDPVKAGSKDLWTFKAVLEGPKGLLAVGWSGACGSFYLDALWTSVDGIVWQPVDAGKVFGVDPWTIFDVSGGGAGFVAVSYGGANVWTSQDGRSWRSVNLKASAFADSRVDDGTALADGYVLAGTTGALTCGVMTYDGPTPQPPLKTAAAWWSADAKAWTRMALPGAVATPDPQWVSVIRLSDHGVLVLDSFGSSLYAWGSTDGRKWVPADLPPDVLEFAFVSTGQRAFLVAGRYGDGEAGDLDLRSVDEGFKMVVVRQTGEVPRFGLDTQPQVDYGSVAVGPTGLVAATFNGSQLWFGSPSGE
jgi:hypothetical protein